MVKSRVGDQLSIVRGQIDLTRPVVTLSSLRQWVQRHPSGAIETIHYDPANAERISLVGVEDDVKWQTVSGYGRGTRTFAGGGTSLLLLGIWLRRRRARSSVPPSP